MFAIRVPDSRVQTRQLPRTSLADHPAREPRCTRLAIQLPLVGVSLDGYYDQIDCVQENTPERLDLKRAILASLDANLRPEVIIASSTSGILPSEFITDGTRHPERILVGHPYNLSH